MVRRLLTIKEQKGKVFHAATLTLPLEYAGNFKVTLKRQCQWFRDNAVGYLYRLDLTQRGVPHIHLLLQVHRDFDWDRLRQYWFRQGGGINPDHEQRGVWHEPVQDMGRYANYLRKSELVNEPLVLPQQRQWGCGGPLEFYEAEIVAEGSARELAPAVRITFGLENAERKQKGKRCLRDKGIGKIRLDAGSVVRNAHRVFPRPQRDVLAPVTGNSLSITDRGNPDVSKPPSPAPRLVGGLHTGEVMAPDAASVDPVSPRRLSEQKPSCRMSPDADRHPALPLPFPAPSAEKLGGDRPARLIPTLDRWHVSIKESVSRNGGRQVTMMEKLGQERYRVIGIPELGQGDRRQIEWEGQTVFVVSVLDAINAERTGRFDRRPCDVQIYLHESPAFLGDSIAAWRERSRHGWVADQGRDGWTGISVGDALPVWDGVRPQARVLFIDPMAFLEETVVDGFPDAIAFLTRICRHFALVPVLDYVRHDMAVVQGQDYNPGQDMLNVIHAIHQFRIPSWNPTPIRCRRVEPAGTPTEEVRERTREEWLEGWRPCAFHGMMDVEVTDWAVLTSCRSGARPREVWLRGDAGGGNRELYVGPEFGGLPSEGWLATIQAHPTLERWSADPSIGVSFAPMTGVVSTIDSFP